MTVTVEPGQFVKETIAYADESDPVTRYLFVAFSQRESITDFGKPPSATLVWGGKRREETTTSWRPTLERDDYLTAESINGSFVLRDTDNTVGGAFGGEEVVVSTSHYEIAPEEELAGLFFRTLSGEVFQK